MGHLWRHPLCVWRHVVWNLARWATGQPTVVGHQYDETETCDHAVVQVLTCRECGHVSVAWRKSWRVQ